MKLIILLLLTASLFAQSSKSFKTSTLNSASFAVTEDSIIGIINSASQLRQDADLLIKRVIIELEKGDKVKIDSLVNNDWYWVSMGEYSGYILTINVRFDDENKLKMDEQIKDMKSLLREQRKIESQKQLEEFKKQCIKKYGKKWGTLVSENKIQIGMTDKMVLDSWGKPNDINRSVGSWGVNEQWVYGAGQYLYFENGKLTSWQD